MLPLHQSLLASLILQKSPVSEAQGKVWSKDDVPLMEEDQVRKYLRKLPTDKSMNPDGMHTKALRELADVITRPLPIIFDQPWKLGQVPKD